MAGAGFKDFTAGAVLTADEVDTYLMQQSIMLFASASSRNTALSGTVAEGMHAYLTDNNQITTYNGSVWRVIYQPETSWTPSWTNITVGNGTSAGQYTRSGDLVHVTAILTLGTTSSITGNAGLGSLPVTGSTTTDFVGPAVYRDTSATNSYMGALVQNSSTSGTFHTHGGGALTSTVPFTWANTDVIRVEITYTAA